MIYFSFVFLVFLNEFYICGWMDVKVDEENMKGDWVKKVCFSWSGGMTAFVLCIGLFLSAGKFSLTNRARNSLISGEAQIYSYCMNNRYEILKNSAGQDVRVDGIGVRPELLFFSDISADSDDWQNISVRDYFDLKSVATW